MFKKIVVCILSLAMMLSILPGIGNGEVVGTGVTNVSASLNKSLYKTVKEAGTEARKKVYNHNAKVVVYVKSKCKEPQTLFDSLEDAMFAETNNPNEGDFMKWDVDETSSEYVAIKSGSYYYYTFTMNVTYLTTIAERDKLDAQVNTMIKDFKFTDKTSTYDKVKKVYDYVCKNVSYAKNSSGTKIYSAYSALIKKKAVCQGFATLLYKVYKTLGIPTRVIAGNSKFSGEEHGWNIVKIGNYYYNLDSTWDSTLLHAGKKYKYFLKGDSFNGHQRWTKYSGYKFYYKYPMAAKAFDAKTVAKASTTTKIAKFKYKKPKITGINRSKVLIKKISGAKYQIKYSTVSNFKAANSTVAKSKKPSYKFKKLKNGTTYFVKVRAYKKINKKKYYTKWSVVKLI
ncbi:MAG: fibronectin type III domain-containing protein [Eubacterium sp.]|nr:fibronectin type III domain-containing protein [Eubacterium sp.]